MINDLGASHYKSALTTYRENSCTDIFMPNLNHHSRSLPLDAKLVGALILDISLCAETWMLTPPWRCWPHRQGGGSDLLISVLWRVTTSIVHLGQTHWTPSSLYTGTKLSIYHLQHSYDCLLCRMHYTTKRLLGPFSPWAGKWRLYQTLDAWGSRTPESGQGPTPQRVDLLAPTDPMMLNAGSKHENCNWKLPMSENSNYRSHRHWFIETHSLNLFDLCQPVAPKRVENEKMLYCRH